MSSRAVSISLAMSAGLTVLALVSVRALGEPITTRLPIFREADTGTPDKSNPAVNERDTTKSNVRPSHAVISDARLMKEFRDISRSDNCKQGVFSVELVDDDLHEWLVKLTYKDWDSALHDDLLMHEARGEDFVVLRISYGRDYPTSPPFVRVARPILRGGFVHDGGAICMELLTKRGWIPSCTSESLILSIQAQLLEGNARVNMEPSVEEVEGYYSDERARERFAQMERDHGWDKRP